MTQRSIRFLQPQPFWADVIPTLLESYLLGTVALETAGTEANIPSQGALVSLFAPHSGWIEPVVVDACFQRAGRTCPLWVTKIENRTLPRFLLGNRFICIDRDRPELSVVRTVYQVLRQPASAGTAPAVASAIEGTRFGNPRDRGDLRTLGRFRTGLVRIAIRARTPILPMVTLGADQVVPRLDEIWHDRGTLGVFKAIQQLRAHPRPIVARVLPLYRDHLDEENEGQGTRLREWAEWHTRRLAEILVARILELEPGYPLGALSWYDPRPPSKPLAT